MGAQMVREVARRPTTRPVTAPPPPPVLAHAILREGMKSVAAGMNPMDLKRGIEKAVVQVVEEIKKKSKKVKESGQRSPRSAQWRPTARKSIGEMIAEAAMQRWATKGVITGGGSQESRQRA